MKKIVNIAIGLSFATAAVHAQNLANYQSTIDGQSPLYHNTFDNTLSPSVGAGTFTANGTAGFGSDYFGNANDSSLYPAVGDYLSVAPGGVVSGVNSATAVGSLSTLFYVPSLPSTAAYFFSGSETTGGAANGQTANSAFSLSLPGGGSGVLQLKVGNQTITTVGTVSAGNWYYLGLSYNLNGIVAGVNGVNWYFGQAGGSTLTTGFKQHGGTGNISATSTLGDGLAFVLGNKQGVVTVGSSLAAALPNGEVDELATWSTDLASSAFTSQYNALVVPEPSTYAMLGVGGLLLLGMRRPTSFGATGRQ
jgi:hypothetical protein